MPSLGPLEIVVIAVVALLVFGPKRLPEVGRQVGRAMRELRKFQDSVRDELHGVMNSMDSQPTTVPNESGDSRPGTPPTLPPVVAPPRQTPPPRPGGAQAPSRFRPSASPPAAASPSATPPTPPASPTSSPTAAPTPKPTAGAHAPSRFRSPNR